MKAEQYIINKINELVVLIPNLRCRYELDFLSNSHFIEVIPNNEYSYNAEFKKFELETTLEFIDLFPGETMCFISDDALVGINKITFEKSGILFGLKTKDLSEKVIVENLKDVLVNFDRPFTDRFAAAGEYSYAMAA